ncbi:MAG: DNA topoisomerase III [Verrucomicrobiota bacterium]
MGKKLVIAEKPSVATDIARVLGGLKKEKDFFEGDEYVVSSAVGHLIEIIPPEGVEPKRGKWKMENLPVIPPKFDLTPIKKAEPRFKLLKRLIKRKDVDSIINACDAGREGELIFRYIIEAAKCKKPIERLWLQSMTPAAIRERFATLKSDEEMQSLADAAKCRSEADWLIGINGTRALTAFNSPEKGFQLTTVGRVQTPTLTILVKRENEIRDFEPVAYWEVHGQFKVKAGVYEGRWFDESFQKPKTERGERPSDKRAERIWTKEQADEIAEFCSGKEAVVEEEKKPSRQASPLLYDLTSLQREANGRFGFSAKSTLGIAQALYERHKVLTYPRTDSRHLPEDYIGSVNQIMGVLKESPYGPHASRILDNKWVVPNKRIFNQAKVSDHFAIIPTTQAPKTLKEQEQKIYDMVVSRFLAIFFPPAVYEVTTRISRVEQHAFKSEGKILKEPGWLEVYGKESTQAASDMVPVAQGEKANVESIEVKGDETRPPARYTEATLLSAMEGAGKLVEDDELREAMAEKGLGTPATRAQIIEGLISQEYIYREQRDLHPTVKAFNLLETVTTMKVPALDSPETTGHWEHKLKEVEQGKFTREDFMKEIQQVTRDVVEAVRGFNPETVEKRETDLIDPFSGQMMVETLKDFRSRNGSLVVRKAIAGRIMDIEEVRVLLEKREVGPLDGFRSRQGWNTFSAYVRLKDDGELELDWGQNDEKNEAEVSFEGVEPLGVHPSLQVDIFETDRAFVSDKKNDEGKPVFRLPKKVLDRELESEQVIKFLKEGKTELLKGFVSRKTKRPFDAFLVANAEEGKGWGFEFPPRPTKKKAAKKKAA